MLKKAFQVQVELAIQAVNCPGVWLCPNGKISLQIYMLDSCVQTTDANPVFPMVYQEKFVFFKTFPAIRKLTALQKALSREILYAELIQWKNCDSGNVLASFRTNLADLLFPEGHRDGIMAGADVDLLMEPMRHFPGILAPKIEVTTKVVIEDKICDEIENSYALNTKVLCSKNSTGKGVLRQKKVCHTGRYHRAKCCPDDLKHRPQFLVKKVDGDLINRKVKQVGSFDWSEKRSPRSGSIPRSGLHSPNRSKSTGRSTSPKTRNKKVACPCAGQTQDNCAVCSKYRRYFESKPVKSKNQNIFPPSLQKQKCPCEQNKLCDYAPQIQPSLAQKIHDRLKQTLSQCQVEAPDLEKCEKIFASSCRCESSESIQDNCTPSNLGEVYKKFNKKIREKCNCY